MTKTQKRILIILGVLDIIVISALAGIVIVTTMRNQPVAEPTQVAENTVAAPPTWTPTMTSTPRPTIPPRPTYTPTPTPTKIPPTPTYTPTAYPTPGPVPIINGDFDLLMPNRIPGWQWYAEINYRPGDELDPTNSLAEPIFRAADDPQREINGMTLQVETIRWLKFRAWVHQTVTVTTGSTVYFEVKAKAYSSLDRLIVKAGIDPNGGTNCGDAVWGQAMYINQDDGAVALTTPRLTVGEAGRVTMCFAAEPAYPHINNAAFFDQAVLIAAPPRNPPPESGSD